MTDTLAYTGTARCGLAVCGRTAPRPQYSPIMAVREVIAGLWPEPIPPRCGISVCGATRLTVGMYWPVDVDTTAYTGTAVCGRARCGRRVRNDGISAGMVPRKPSHNVTLALTPLQGGLPDRRPAYGTAYDNPAFVLHVIGDGLVTLDEVAHKVREELDRTAHITTGYGTINTLAVGPPTRAVRPARPRYDVQMTVYTEMERDTWHT